MSDVLSNIAALNRAIAIRNERLAKPIAQEEDTAIMALQEDVAVTLALATAMTHAKRVYLKTLSKAQQEVAQLRLDIGDKWPNPDVMDSYVFLVSEVGEVGDALLRSNYGHRTDYSRNNTKYADVGAELGDVFLMLCTLATALGIDLDEALLGCINRLRSKYDTTEPINNTQVR